MVADISAGSLWATMKGANMCMCFAWENIVGGLGTCSSVLECMAGMSEILGFDSPAQEKNEEGEKCRLEKRVRKYSKQYYLTHRRN